MIIDVSILLQRICSFLLRSIFETSIILKIDFLIVKEVFRNVIVFSKNKAVFFSEGLLFLSYRVIMNIKEVKAFK